MCSIFVREKNCRNYGGNVLSDTSGLGCTNSTLIKCHVIENCLKFIFIVLLMSFDTTIYMYDFASIESIKVRGGGRNSTKRNPKICSPESVFQTCTFLVLIIKFVKNEFSTHINGCQK